MGNWFQVLIIDLVGGLITTGFLEALTKINYKWGLFIGSLITITDYIVWLNRGNNIATKIIEYFNKLK